MYYNYFKKFFKYFIDNKRTFYTYFILSFFVGLMELFGVALTYPFINQLLSKNKIDTLSILFACAIIVAFLAKNIFMIFYNSLQINFTKNCEASIARKFMQYFIYGDYNKTSELTFAKKIQILKFLTPDTINNYLVRILNLNVNIFIFALITLFLFIKFFIATVITLICSFILLTSQAIFFKYKIKKASGLLNTVNEKLSVATNEPLLNMKNVKVLSTEDYFFDKYNTRFENYKKIASELAFYNAIPPYITEPFIIITLLILLTIISIQNLSNTTTLVASYAVIVSAIFRLAPTISRIQTNLTGINASIPQLKKLFEYYEAFDLGNFRIKKESIANFNTSIEFKNISFSYEEKKILNNISFKINKGDFIGIAGPSGVGKTTLIDILSGLLNFDTGEVLIDGTPTITNKVPKLSIGYIPQEFSIIATSIRENIALGHDNIDDEKVINALKKAQLYDYITANYKEGIYAKPFTDSNGLSQGQKQRIAIARALYTDPDILILDEATSSLDLKTEEEICDVLNELKGQKTIITIAHRLSTIKKADTVILMKDSTVNDKGSFEELYHRNSYFKELVELNDTNSVH